MVYVLVPNGTAQTDGGVLKAGLKVIVALPLESQVAVPAANLLFYDHVSRSFCDHVDPLK